MEFSDLFVRLSEISKEGIRNLYIRGRYVATGVIILMVCFVILLSLQHLTVSKLTLRQFTVPLNHSSTKNNSQGTYLNFQPNHLATSVTYLNRQGIHIKCALKNFSPLPLPITALASIPGSGNTWARTVIELITGIYTGAVYDDKSLAKIFKGEGIRDWSVVAVKIHNVDTNFTAGHCEPLLNSRDCDLKRVILVIRHPADATLAEYKRRRTHSHTKDVQASFEEFEAFYQDEIKVWENFHQAWLYMRRQLSLDVFLLYYADLRDNFTTAVANLAYFLGAEMDDTRVKCLRDYNQGYFHRKGKTVNITRIKDDNFTKAMVDSWRNLFVSCVNERKCATSGSVWNL